MGETKKSMRLKKYNDFDKINEDINAGGAKNGYILHKDGWVFNSHFLHRAPNGGTLWPAMKRLEDISQDEWLSYEFFIEEGSHILKEYQKMVDRVYNPDSKQGNKNTAVFVSEEDVYGGDIPATNDEEGASYKKYRGSVVVFLTKSNGKSAALKNKYLSQYNDLSGFELIPAFQGIMIDWDKKGLNI